MVKPRSEHFKEHPRFQGLHFIGELQKPYSLQVTIEKPCDTELEMMAPVQDYPISAHLMKYDFITVPPRNVQKPLRCISIWPILNFVKKDYTLPGLFTTPSMKPSQKSNEKISGEKEKTFDDLVEESASYIEQQQLSPIPSEHPEQRCTTYWIAIIS